MNNYEVKIKAEFSSEDLIKLILNVLKSDDAGKIVTNHVSRDIRECGTDGIAGDILKSLEN